MDHESIRLKREFKELKEKVKNYKKENIVRFKGIKSYLWNIERNWINERDYLNAFIREWENR